MTAAETHEWANLRGAISNIEASRDLVIHRAQMTGGSEETSREIANIMGSTWIASAGGIAGGIGKGKPSTPSGNKATTPATSVDNLMSSSSKVRKRQAAQNSLKEQVAATLLIKSLIH